MLPCLSGLVGSCKALCRPVGSLVRSETGVENHVFFTLPDARARLGFFPLGH